MTLEFFLFKVFFFNFSSFLFASAPFFVLFLADFVLTFLFLGLLAGLLIAIEVETVDSALSDEDLREIYITS